MNSKTTFRISIVLGVLISTGLFVLWLQTRGPRDLDRGYAEERNAGTPSAASEAGGDEASEAAADIPEGAGQEGGLPLLSDQEADELDEVISSLPFDLDGMPPQILDDIKAIAEAGEDGGVPPHILEELQEQVNLAGHAGAQVAEMALETMIETQLAWERYQLDDHTIVMPSDEELIRMKEEANAQEPTPYQWELLRNTR